jgi:hypothetical protein
LVGGFLLVNQIGGLGCFIFFNRAMFAPSTDVGPNIAVAACTCKVIHDIHMVDLFDFSARDETIGTRRFETGEQINIDQFRV